MKLNIDEISNFWKIPIKKNTKNLPLGKWEKIKQKDEIDTKNNNYGILTGKKNNVIVVDLDCHKWEDNHIFNDTFNIDELSKETYSVKSINGGYHLYYVYDDDIYQTQSDEYQIDTRSNGGYIIGAGSSINNKKYKVLNNAPIIQMPTKLKEFLIKYVCPPKIKRTKKINSNNINHINMSMLENIMTTKQKKNFCKNLKNIYWEGYTNFLKWTSFCKSMDIKKLWEIENARRPNYNENTYEKNENIWNGCKTGDGFIIDFLRSNDEKILNYWFYRPILNNEIQPNVIIDKQKLGYTFFKQKYNYVVKSDTGTGKSTSFYKYVKNNNKKFISIVSRISLGEEQYNKVTDLGIPCKFYSNDGFINNGDNIVITIDSIMKLRKFDFNQYVIFLDEYNSLIEYLITSTTLNNKRTLVYNIFFKIINECKQFIGTDADITDNSLSLLKYTDKKYKFIKNSYKHNKDVKAYEIFSVDDFIEDIKKQDKFLVCCDSKNNAELIYNLLKNKSIKLITSTTDEHIDFDKHDKIIYSPKIVYGIDSSMKRNVYCFYKEHTISPKAMVQQVARCRNIIELKYLFLKKKLSYSDVSFEDTKQLVIDEDKYASYEFQLNCSEIVNKQYLNLLARFEYDNICYSTNKFAHFIKLLLERGFIIETEEKYTSKDKLSNLLKEAKQLKEEDFSIDNPSVKEINKILKIPTEEIENYKQYFLNPHLLEQHFNLCKFRNIDQDTLKIKITEKEEFNTKKTTSVNMKIMYLHRFLEKLKTDTEKVFEMNEYKLSPTERDRLFNDYNTIFRNRNTKKDFQKDYDIKYYLSVIYKNLFSKNIVDSTRKGQRVYKINKEFIEENDKIYDYRKPKDKFNGCLFNRLDAFED